MVEILVLIAAAGLAFSSGCIFQVRVIWIIAPVCVLAFVWAAWGSSDSEIAWVFGLLALVASCYWTIFVLAERGLQKLLRAWWR